MHTQKIIKALNEYTYNTDETIYNVTPLSRQKEVCGATKTTRESSEMTEKVKVMKENESFFNVVRGAAVVVVVLFYTSGIASFMLRR